MPEQTNMTRAQKALLAAQQAAEQAAQQAAEQAAEQAAQKAADKTFTEVSNLLRDHECVAFALTCGRNFDSAPMLDVAVRLLWIACYSSYVDDGQMVRELRPESVTPEAIDRATHAVAECASLLKRCGVQYTLLAHVHGKSEIEVHFRCERRESPFAELANGLAGDVAMLPRISMYVCLAGYGRPSLQRSSPPVINHHQNPCVIWRPNARGALSKRN